MKKGTIYGIIVILFMTCMLILIGEKYSNCQEGKWHEQYKIVAHAMGGIDGKVYTNSLEAFENAYNNGIRVFEVDFAYTADDEIVLCHNWMDMNSVIYTAELTEQWGWKEPPKYEDYITSKILYKYTPLSLEDMVLLLKKYKDCYFVTDSKYIDKEHIEDEFSRLVEVAEDVGAMEEMQRIIVQIYNDDMYTYVKDIYPFEQWIYTLYALPSIDYDVICQFCVQNGIDVVATSEGWAKQVWSNKVHEYGLKYYIYTINSINDWKYVDSVGVDGIYSDFLIPNDYFLFHN